MNIRTYLKRNSKSSLAALIVVLAVLVTGSVILLTKAAGTVVSSEGESGTKSANIQTVSDATASGSSAVMFKTAATAPGCTPVAGIPAGFPNNCNSGYKAAPGYPGSLTPFTGTIQSNTTYSFKDFPSGASIGTTGTPVSNVTFYGCRFHDINLDGALIVMFGDNITLDYSSLEPEVTAPPVPYNKGYQYGLEANGSYNAYVQKFTVSHSEIWGFGNAIDASGSTQAKPHVFRSNYIHDPRADGGIDHTDGIGELNGANSDYVVIDNNTIIGDGNTNGIAYQYGPYRNFTVTNNYFSGYGYMINLGGYGGPTNITFTDNVWGTNIQQSYGPWYSWAGTGNLWRRNKIHFVNQIKLQGDDPNSYVIKATDDGKFWTPSGISTTDYTGN